MSSDKKIKPSRNVENGDDAEALTLNEQIALSAYFKAEARGFAPGGEI